MTYKSREVLGDCCVALQMLEEEKDLQKWRIIWIAAVALLRAVGHVLHKVDGLDPENKKIATAAFRRWKGDAPEHAIFRDFIDNERNNILKEYQVNLHPMDAVPVVIQAVLKPLDGGPSKVVQADILELDENIYRPVLDGPWEGIDARDLLREAIEWWDRELSMIEEHLGKVRNSRSPT